MPLKTLHIFTELNGRGAAGEGGGEQPNDAEVILRTSSFKSFISDKHYTEEERRGSDSDSEAPTLTLTHGLS